MTAVAAAPASRKQDDAVGLPAHPVYRPDIDSLRAIAVTSVVLFHAGLQGLPGGFTGVDVFFVISGYLIGGHIFAEASAGRFSFASFYARRVRRILPALFALLAVLYTLGLLLLTPQELRELGKESVAAIAGQSNLLFYTGMGYFAPAADHSPLLMTWSLGVEEQFYIIFPFVMLGALRLGRRWVLPLIAILSVASLAGSLLLMHYNPKAAFYLLPTRAWELGIGAVLALWERRGDHGLALPRPFVELCSLVGVGLIAAGLLLYREGTPFPGTFVLAPTVGTALLIATGASTINRRLLSVPPVVFVGKVSYSWYLWHWPLFYLDRVLAEGDGGLSPAVLVAVSFALAVLSWRFVEQPLRRPLLPRRTVLWRYAAAGVIATLPALLFYATHGLPQRLGGAARLAAIEAQQARSAPCLARFGARGPINLDTCLPPLAKGTDKRLLVIGDSHADAIAPGFAAQAQARGLGFGQLTKSSCPPLWGYTAYADRVGHVAECIAYQNDVFARATEDRQVSDIVLAGFWQSNATVQDGEGREHSLEEALDRTIARLKPSGRRITIVQDVPMFGFDPYARVIGDGLPLRDIARRLVGNESIRNGLGSPLKDRSRGIAAAVAARYPGVLLSDPWDTLCQAGRCRYASQDGRLYYTDFQHLTAAGARAALADRDTRSP
jgi:peptidoglycan/LPS O-acetylase OafA/YrhL